MMELTDTTLSVNERAVRVLTSGSGPLTLFLHGFGVTADMWRPNLLAVAEAGYTALALDLPGHGASYHPSHWLRVHDLAHVVAELLDALQVERVCLVGNSLGGAVASEFALMHPERVTRLVLVDSLGLDAHLPVLRRSNYWTHLLLPGAVEMAVGRRQRTRRRMLRMIYHSPERVPPDALVLDYAGGWRRNYVGRGLVGLGVFWQMFSHRRRRAFAQRRAGLTMPVLITWGENDQLLPVAHAHAAQTLIPHARVRIFPDCGHAPNIEYAEAFNREVIAFLSEEPALHTQQSRGA